MEALEHLLTPEVPASLAATLLAKYQVGSYTGGCRSSRHWGFGYAADDIKASTETVQAIAVLLERAGEGPAMVVAPASVRFNWRASSDDSAPSLSKLVLRLARHSKNAPRRR